MARRLGASDFVATLPGAAFSLMQFLFIPLWGRLSDRVGRRPVLLWSIAASAVGMACSAWRRTLPLLFVARLFSGIATANIAVAQAYIADVTTPENRARGMGIIGMAFGLGFIFGPVHGRRAVAHCPVFGREGTLPAVRRRRRCRSINFLLALRTLPESLPPERARQALRRARAARPRARCARRSRVPGVGAAVADQLLRWCSGSPAWSRRSDSSPTTPSACRTPRPGASSASSASSAPSCRAGLVRRLAPRFGEARLVQWGVGFGGGVRAARACRPFRRGWACVALYISAGLIALGNG